MNINNLNKKSICYSCVGEDYLNLQIKRGGTKRKCDYCGRHDKSYLVGTLAERVEKAFLQHYKRIQPTPLEVMLLEKDIEDWTLNSNHTVDAIKEACDIPVQAANDVQKILQDKYADYEDFISGNESKFSNESRYSEKELYDYLDVKKWEDLERKIKYKVRFFNDELRNFLTDLFTDIDKLKTKNNLPVVIVAGPGKELNTLYRARMFQSEEMLKKAIKKPDVELGPPPSKLATAGRMNPQGISVFYGAMEQCGAISEVRPPVGSNVLVAQFKIIRQLKLLNLETLKDVWTGGSIFDNKYISQLEHADFLRWLCYRFAEPIMPDDEPFDYLATQAVAHFLENEITDPIDGIIYPSAQTSQAEYKFSNIILFHKSALVKPMEKLMGEEIEVWIEEYSEDNDREKSFYRIVSTFNETNEMDADIYIDSKNNSNLDSDCREPSLSIITESLQVHEVKSVKINTNNIEVINHFVNKGHDSDIVTF